MSAAGENLSVVAEPEGIREVAQSSDSAAEFDLAAVLGHQALNNFLLPRYSDGSTN